MEDIIYNVKEVIKFIPAIIFVTLEWIFKVLFYFVIVFGGMEGILNMIIRIMGKFIN